MLEHVLSIKVTVQGSWSAAASQEMQSYPIVMFQSYVFIP